MSDIDEATRAALLLADKSPDEAAQARLRRRKRFIIGRRIAFLAAATIIGAGIAIYFAGQLPRAGSDVLAWQRTLGYCLTVGGFVLEIAYFIVVVGNGEFGAGWRSPSLVLSWRQRRAIRQQISGKRPVDPAVLPISRELATRTKQATALAVMLVAFPMIIGGQALLSGSESRLHVAIAFTALYLGMIPYIFWESRRAARFLERNPAPAPVHEE